MKLGKHGKFLYDFVESFLNEEINRSEFDLDYSGYVIAHFPGFKRETPRLAARFASTVDLAYESFRWMEDDDRFYDAIADAFDEFFGIQPVSDFI